MQWSDEGYLLSKNNFDENSIIIEAFTSYHGKYTGIVYGGSSRKQKKFSKLVTKSYFIGNLKVKINLVILMLNLSNLYRHHFLMTKKKPLVYFQQYQY